MFTVYSHLDCLITIRLCFLFMIIIGIRRAYSDLECNIDYFGGSSCITADKIATRLIRTLSFQRMINVPHHIFRAIQSFGFASC
jgi:hypothetical protein